VIGGDGSLSIARRLEARGVAVVGIPRTIEKDVLGTDVTLGIAIRGSWWRSEVAGSSTS
jgi:6-phosphofructokinase